MKYSEVTPKTKDQVRAEFMAAQMFIDTKAALVERYNTSYDFLWYNPLGLTPEEAAEALGREGSRAYKNSGALYMLIASEFPEENLRMAPRVVILSGEGTMRISKAGYYAEAKQPYILTETTAQADELAAKSADEALAILKSQQPAS